MIPPRTTTRLGNRVLPVVLNILLAMAGMVAVFTLVLQYGGFSYDSLPLSRDTLINIQMVVVLVFILDRFLRLMISRSRLEYLKDNWLDFTLIFLLIVAGLVIYRYKGDLLSAGVLYILVTQIYLLAVLILRVISAHYLIAGSGLPPSWLVIGSFMSLWLVGSGLLMLPAAVRQEYWTSWNYLDALFTSVSATCVTGLVVVDTGTHFTFFGQAVILFLIQLGGLGIMIFGTMLAILAGRALTIRSSEALSEMLASDERGNMARMVKFVVSSTFIIEIIGAICLYSLFSQPTVLDASGQRLTFAGTIWYSVFHSISAFCNAGFALYGQNLMQGTNGGWAVPLREHWQILGVVAPLIILGGLGFPVLGNLFEAARDRIRRRKQKNAISLKEDPKKNLYIHTKIVLVTSAVLVILGAVGFSLVETGVVKPKYPDLMHSPSGRNLSSGEWASMNGIQRLRESFFQSVTARTAGFNTMDMGSLSTAGKLWMCGLMTIGGSPASTAGGMKTITVALLFISAWCILKQRNSVEVFGRTIADELFRRAATLALLYIFMLAVVTFMLCMAMPAEQFIDLLFEACSACGTVGLSTGVTSRLTVFSKIVVILGMFIGRIGPLTLIIALGAHVRKANYSYPVENVIIG
ncbi:MAG TPA: potassium transporter TrkG [Phycisphaerae bacterium]|nr:potassium transporter TrkG [Phycisphaerae bacterium]HPS52124.1 potassium transporter TrkG [Phycisphaerae bacterium]